MKYQFINQQFRDPAVTAGLISAGAAIASQGANAYAVGKMNLRSRQFAEEMYFRQRADALADWNMQNEYNSPRAQMARFKEAGLNPHLIYGKTGEGATVRSSSPQPWRPDSPQFDFGSASSQYFNTQAQVAQTNNLKKQQEILDEQANSLRANTLKTLADTDLSKLSFDTQSQLQQYQLEAAKLMNIKTGQDIELAFTGMQNTLRLAEKSIEKTDQDISESLSRMAKNQAEILNIRANTAKTNQERTNLRLQAKQIEEMTEDIRSGRALKDYQILDRAKGIRPGDPGYVNVVKDAWEWLMKKQEEMQEYIKKHPYKK